MNFAAVFTEALVPRILLPLGSWQISLFYWLCSVVPQVIGTREKYVMRTLPAGSNYLLGTNCDQTWGTSHLQLVSVRFNGSRRYYAAHWQENTLCSNGIYVSRQVSSTAMRRVAMAEPNCSVLIHVVPPLFYILFPDVIDEDMTLHRRRLILCSV